MRRCASSFMKTKKVAQLSSTTNRRLCSASLTMNRFPKLRVDSMLRSSAHCSVPWHRIVMVTGARIFSQQPAHVQFWHEAPDPACLFRVRSWRAKLTRYALPQFPSTRPYPISNVAKAAQFPGGLMQGHSAVREQFVYLAES